MLENAEASIFHEDINKAAPIYNYRRVWGGAGGNGGGDKLGEGFHFAFRVTESRGGESLC